MAINYPTSLDTTTQPSAGNVVDSARIAKLIQMVEALEAKVGITGSAVSTSLDKRIAVLEAAGAGAIAGDQAIYGYNTTAGFGCIAARLGMLGTLVPNTGNTMIITYFRAPKTLTANTVTYNLTGAGSSVTVAQFGIYSVTESTGALVALLGSTANDTTVATAGASGTVAKTKALQAGTSLTAGTVYALGLLNVLSGTTPAYLMAALTNQSQVPLGTIPRLTGQVAGLGALPASVASGSVVAYANQLWAELS